MDDLVASLDINNLSKQQVSNVAKGLDSMVEDLRTRPFDTGPHFYVSRCSLTMIILAGGSAVKTSMLLTTGVNAEDYRDLLGM